MSQDKETERQRDKARSGIKYCPPGRYVPLSHCPIVSTLLPFVTLSAPLPTDATKKDDPKIILTITIMLLLSLVVRAENLLNLVDVELLHVVACRTEVLTRVELTWLLCEDLTYCCCHGEA